MGSILDDETSWREYMAGQMEVYQAVYGLWPRVAAIVGDAELKCLSCAVKAYGPVKVTQVMNGDDTVLSHEGEAHGGYFLGAVLRGSQDLYTEESGFTEPECCMACGEPLA